MAAFRIDLKRIHIKEALTIIPVSHVDEVLKIALVDEVAPISWTEADELAAQPPTHGDQEASLRH